MKPPVKIQKVFLVKGLRRIREVDADIYVCNKMTWAQVGTRRFLLGTSAFFTRKAAEVRKLGELRKLAELAKYPTFYGDIGRDAQLALKAYEATGTIN